ncbi:MAG: histidine kinase [Chitinophagales bacterium]|nr:histidine kinase [Chitinophagales bacterium]
MQVKAMDWLGISLREAIADSFVSNALLAAVCILVSNHFRFYLPQKERVWFTLVRNAGLTAVWLMVTWWLLAQINTSNSYSSFLYKSLPARFLFAFLVIGISAMVSMLWYTLEEQKSNEQRKTDAEKLSREAELFKLRQQLQPHFLFNSLNSISALVGSRPEEARRMIQQLSDFLRRTLRKDEHQWVSLAEELQYLELYLDIEKVRFGYRLSTIIESDEESRQMEIPAMLLQPIVENAIKFGLYDTIEAITIHVRIKAEEQHLVITVDNPFDPETSQPIKGTGFGLASIQRRLYLLFARNDLLQTEISGKNFITLIKIPQHHD